MDDASLAELENSRVAKTPETPIVTPTDTVVTPVVAPTEVVTPTPVATPEAKVVEPVIPKKPNKLKEGLFKTKTDAAAPPATPVDTTDWKAKFEGITKDPSYIALRKAQEQNKSVFDITDEIKSQDPKKLSREQVFVKMLQGLNMSDEEIATEVEDFKDKKPYEQVAIIKPKQDELERTYKQDLDNFVSTYQPQENAIAKTISDYAKAAAEAKGKELFDGALVVDDAVAKTTEQFANSNITPQQMHEAFTLYANREIAFLQYFKAGEESVRESEIEAIQGSGDRSIKQTVTPKADISIEARQADAEAAIAQQSKRFDTQIFVPQTVSK